MCLVCEQVDVDLDVGFGYGCECVSVCGCEQFEFGGFWIKMRASVCFTWQSSSLLILSDARYLSRNLIPFNFYRIVTIRTQLQL